VKKIILAVFVISCLVVGIWWLGSRMSAKETILNQKTSKNTTSKTTMNSENTITTASGLKYIDLELGIGDRIVKAGDQISIHYVGTLENGTKFDSSLDRGTPFETMIGVGEVIKGWDEGVQGMKVEGKRKLIIPPNLGYGSQDMGVIPPNSTLIFEVTLKAIK
jgi:peptidylprolyl isomerase